MIRKRKLLSAAAATAFEHAAEAAAEAESVSITYGGVGIGAGNICDSDEWSTWTKYLTDVGDTGYDGNRSIYQSPRNKDGDVIVGESYPMNNFLTLFYKEL